MIPRALLTLGKGFAQHAREKGQSSITLWAGSWSSEEEGAKFAFGGAVDFFGGVFTLIVPLNG